MYLRAILFVAAAGCAGESSPSETPPAQVDDVPDPSGTPVQQVGAGEATQCDLAQLDAPRVYGHKVKTLLTGLPLTAEELTRLESQPDALRGLIDTWMETESFRTVLLRFFQTAFQQNELDVDGLTTMLRRNNLNLGRFETPRVSLRELLEL
ncbi:MAG: hypothetical protein AAFU79_27765, partial [Myxococcota bacterium]